MMSDLYVIGVDGGGSGIRAVVVKFSPEGDWEVIGQAVGETANPSLIGQKASAELIRHVLADAVEASGLEFAQIGSVALGVAGASKMLDWLQVVPKAVLPDASVYACTDAEIALVGGRGTREGLLILAGTGSVLFALDRQGKSHLSGGWGYLIGDEGSGFWLASTALRYLSEQVDGVGQATLLKEAICTALSVSDPRDLIPIIYDVEGEPPNKRLADLAPIILACAQEGDPLALKIVHDGAEALAKRARVILQKTGLSVESIAFSGGLLSFDNVLSLRLTELLGLQTRPHPLFPPVIGAAILARHWVLEGGDKFAH